MSYILTKEMTELQIYSGKEGKGFFRPMTLDEIKNLSSGSTQWFITQKGDARRCKINGKVQTWKRDPNRFSVPVKYGMYEFARIEEPGRLLIQQSPV